MRDLLEHPWVKVLLIATTIAMCTFALRETAWITVPIVSAFKDVLLPVIVGFAIAYVLTPIVDAISRQGGVRRFVAASILYGCVALLLITLVVLVVPAVIHEGKNLTQRVFVGDPHAAPGTAAAASDTPFSTLVRHDGLLNAGLERLAAWQNNLKVIAHLAFNDTDLAFLSVCQEQTSALRDWQERMLSAARSGAGPESWPAAPDEISASRQGPAGDQPSDPVFTWPSPATETILEAARGLPGEDRSAWLDRMVAADHVLNQRMTQQLAALELARGRSEDPDAVAIRSAQKQGLKPDQRSAAVSFSEGLVAADQKGEALAHQVLHSLQGESPIGSKTLATLAQQADDAVRNAIEQSPKQFGDWGKALGSDLGSWVNLAIDVFLVPIYAFFLVLAMPAIRRGVHRYIPVRRSDQTLRIIRDIEQVVSAFFRGRLIICTLCSLVGWLGFSMIGWFSVVSMPYAALFGIAIGFATIVPLSGLLFLIPAIALTMIQPGATMLHAVLVLSVYVVVQSLEAILIPLIMGHEVELHPVMLIVALFLCGKLFGIIGLILAVPIAATCRILAREFLWPRLQEWVDRPARPKVAPVPSAASLIEHDL